MPAGSFPLLLAAHVTLALALFVPSFLLPFTLRTRGRDGIPRVEASGPFVRLLMWLETRGSMVVGVGVAVTGVALLASVGWAFLSRPWLLAAILIYGLVLASAYFVQRPGLRRLLHLPAARDEAERERWRTRARRQRYLSYGLAAAIGFIGWLMMAKPEP